MATAKEIIELRGLEKACRSATDKDFAELWPKIYDPESKSRLLTLITALLGLVITFLAKNEAFNFIEAMSDEGTWALLKALAQLAVITFITCVAGYQVLRQILEFVLYLFSSVFPVLHSRQITLDYLIRDLIQYHRMEPPAPPAAEPEPVPEIAPATPPHREPGLGTLIAAVCLSLLRQPPPPSDNAKAAPAAQNNKSDRP